MQTFKSVCCGRSLSARVLPLKVNIPAQCNSYIIENSPAYVKSWLSASPRFQRVLLSECNSYIMENIPSHVKSDIWISTSPGYQCVLLSTLEPGMAGSSALLMDNKNSIFE